MRCLATGVEIGSGCPEQGGGDGLADAGGLGGVGQRQRDRAFAAAGGGAGGHLQLEGLLEALEEIAHGVAVRAVGIAEFDAVAPGALADDELAACADHLGLRFVAMGEGARCVEHRPRAAFELDDGQAVVDVAQRGRVGVQRDGAGGEGPRGPRAARHPAGEVDVVHAAVHDFFLERYAEAYRLELTRFVEALDTQRPPAPGVDDGVRALELAEAAARSWREGRVVELDEAVETVQASALAL
ncbi:hypothetical protein ACEQUB_01990 [Ralstonia syzygii]